MAAFLQGKCGALLGFEALKFPKHLKFPKRPPHDSDSSGLCRGSPGLSCRAGSSVVMNHPISLPVDQTSSSLTPLPSACARETVHQSH